MKERTDLASGWLRKAVSDSVAMRASAAAGSLDSACFHAQQAAEKYLKAFLARHGVEVPRTHNLLKLVELCEGEDPAFAELADVAELLTPFAVEARYDMEFWPATDAVEQAEQATGRIADFVAAR